VKKGTPAPPEGRPALTGFLEARELVERHVRSLPAEEVPLERALHRILAEEATARVSSPTHDVSLKDGFAVLARDTGEAAPEGPAVLRLDGSRFAGGLAQEARAPRASPGPAVRVTSGAVLPEGADAVVGAEYCEEVSDSIRIVAPVAPGKNILPRGTDIAEGEVLGRAGDLLAPGRLGWLAAAGVDRVRVFRVPRAALVATGDEVVAPGAPLRPGQLYASNLCTLSAWLGVFGSCSTTKVLPDRPDVLSGELPGLLAGADVLLTSGGAWGSERDLVVRVLDDLGWRKLFHRVRLGPGKAVGFGLLEGKPVFCLPGGPPSNEMAFLQLALPGVLRLMGRTAPPFPVVEARLTQPLKGREIDWTQIRRGRIEQAPDGSLLATPYRPLSRLQSMALADCLIELPEGTERIEAGQRVRVQLLCPPESFLLPWTVRGAGGPGEP